MPLTRAQVTLLLRSLTELRGSPLECLQGACLLLSDALDASLARWGPSDIQ